MIMQAWMLFKRPAVVHRATESLPLSMSLLHVRIIYKSDILIVTTWNSP